jgi:hypothetical protein
MILLRVLIGLSPAAYGSQMFERISGPWWAVAIIMLAPTIALVTSTLGRGSQASWALDDPSRAAATPAPVAAASPKERRWTSG